MANAGGIPDPEQKPDSLNPNLDEIEEDYDVLEEEEEDDEDHEEDSEAAQQQRKSRVDRPKIENLFRRMRNGPVPLRVHDVIVKGNTKTRDYLIEAELDAIRNATTMQEIIQAANIINYKLRELECFDSVEITLDSGPPELPGTSNVIIQVVETKSPLSGQIGTYTKGEVYISSAFYLFCVCFRMKSVELAGY